ncbi:uncharacterized protein [Hemitrygon akajei]|uniref:uncharacterized protein n=1 Tax=Hemitrygon akajei TaxID=2704970 RepID=UPI003BF9DE5C
MTPEHGLRIASPAVDLGCLSDPGHIQNPDSSTITACSDRHGFAPAVDLGYPSNPGHIENLDSSTINAGSNDHGQLQSDCATTDCDSSLELQAESSHAVIVTPVSPSPTTTLQSPLPQIPLSAPGPSEAPSSSHPNPSLFTDTTSLPPPSDPISHPCRVFTIPSNLQLSEAERSVLGKGLSFVPLCPHLSEFHVRHDAELFFCQLHLRAYFFGKDSSTPTDDPFSRLQPSSSSWTPCSGLLPALDLFIANCRQDINRLDFTTPCSNFNLSPSECSALRSLHTNPNLTIKPADKGGAVVVWRTDLYLAEAQRQLSDTSSYLPLDHDPTKEHQAIVSYTISNLISSGESPIQCHQPHSSHTPHFPFLPPTQDPQTCLSRSETYCLSLLLPH